METSQDTTAIASNPRGVANKFIRLISNCLFAVAALCGIFGVLMTSVSSPDPGLTARSAEVDLADVTAGSKVPVKFALHNRTGKPIRLLGAEDT